MYNLTSEEKRIIKERKDPKIYHWTFLILREIKKTIRQFNGDFLKNKKDYDVIDVGCGYKPYQSFFKNYNKYVGLDIEKNPLVDIISPAWNMPLRDNEFDILIATCVLEHSLKLQETVREFWRVLKPGGLAFISVPLIDPEHGAPHDFWRFTQYAIPEIFHQFKILSVKKSNGYLSTFTQLFNLFLAQLPYGKTIFVPFFIISNALTIFLDWLIATAYKINSKTLELQAVKNFYEITFWSLPRNYFIILQKE